MSIEEVFLLIVRWLHTMAAVIWIGGGLFYLLVLRPRIGSGSLSDQALNRATAYEFRGLVDTSILVLLVTGVILTFDRISVGFIDVPYVATLGIKILLSLWMFYLAYSRIRNGSSLKRAAGGATAPVTRYQKAIRAVSGYNAIVILGVLVFLLADLLKFLFEKALEGA